ncbi:unnamed protein product [Ilex paraguariensis]|uniref:Uncharacterized protein n=1 Tax=Ilex paraguariensis TaxID=185542 RepID=A0ABC8U125_9AQUA
MGLSVSGRSRLKSVIISSNSKSSTSGKRKKVSDWARRWWARRFGVSSIWSRNQIGMIWIGLKGSVL